MQLMLLVATLVATADSPSPSRAAVLHVRGEFASARAEIDGVLAKAPQDPSALFAAACFALETTGPTAAREYASRLKRNARPPPQAAVLDELLSRRERAPFEPIEDAVVAAWKKAGRPDLASTPLLERLEGSSVIPAPDPATLRRMSAAERLIFAYENADERLQAALRAADHPELNPLVVNLEILQTVAPYESLPSAAVGDAKRAAERVGSAVAKTDPSNGYFVVAAWLASGAAQDPMSASDLSLLEAAAERPRFEVPRRELIEQLRVLARRFDPKYGELRARSAAMAAPVPLFRLWQRADATTDASLRRRAGAILSRLAARLACSGTMLERMLGISLAGKGAALVGDEGRREAIRAGQSRLQAANRSMTEAQKQLGVWPFAGPWRDWDADREMEYFESLLDEERRPVIGETSCATRPEPRRAWSEPGARQVREFHRASGVIFSPCSDETCLRAAEKGCRPSHLARAYNTIEGTPAFSDIFVVPTGKACKVVAFGDFSRDYWGGCRVSKTTCPSVEAATSDRWDTMGCTPNEVLFEVHPCENR